MKEVRSSMNKVQSEVRRLAAQLQDHAVYQELRAGTLSLERYQLLLWVLRQVHVGFETQAWDSRSDSVRRVCKQLTRKRPALERDLVAACGKTLVVPRPVNEPLDGYLASLDKPTTPARILGRLLFAEALLAGHAVPHSGFVSNAQLPDTAGDYLSRALDADEFAEVCQLFAHGLVGEVPVNNAYQAAQALRGALTAALDAVLRCAAQRRVNLEERSA